MSIYPLRFSHVNGLLRKKKRFLKNKKNNRGQVEQVS